MCRATANHNFKWVKNTHIYKIWIKIYNNLPNLIVISFIYIFF